MNRCHASRWLRAFARPERAALALALLCGACAAPPRAPSAPEDAAGGTVYLVAHGWHAGIVVRRADIPPGVWPEREDFPEAEYLEVGWGEREGYMGPITLLSVVKAVLWPGRSVLHVAGFRGPVREFFARRGEILEFELPPERIEALSRHIARSFARDGLGRARRLGPGLYGQGSFYPSRERYHLFNTCNVWTARALRAAGLPLVPAMALTVGMLTEQARPFGRRPAPAVQPASPPSAGQIEQGG